MPYRTTPSEQVTEMMEHIVCLKSESCQIYSVAENDLRMRTVEQLELVQGAIERLEGSIRAQGNNCASQTCE